MGREGIIKCVDIMGVSNGLSKWVGKGTQMDDYFVYMTRNFLLRLRASHVIAGGWVGV